MVCGDLNKFMFANHLELLLVCETIFKNVESKIKNAKTNADVGDKSANHRNTTNWQAG